MTRDKIRVQMGFEYVTDLEAVLLGSVEVNLDVPLWVDNCSFAAGSQHVRSMRQASEIELFEVHGLTSISKL